MKGIFPMLAIAIVLAAAGGLYGLKHRVETRRDAVQSLERQILRDREAIRVLKAEWAYLTNPDLLQARARRHLSLAPARSGQIAVSLARLPFRGRKLLAGGVDESGADPLPHPRMKPPAPPRPAGDAARLVSIRREDAPGMPGKPTAKEDFTARIRAVLERMGEGG